MNFPPPGAANTPRESLRNWHLRKVTAPNTKMLGCAQREQRALQKLSLGSFLKNHISPSSQFMNLEHLIEATISNELGSSHPIPCPPGPAQDQMPIAPPGTHQAALLGHWETAHGRNFTPVTLKLTPIRLSTISNVGPHPHAETFRSRLTTSHLCGLRPAVLLRT
jgi:hypothetical protein